ncbi:MAG TPA: NAD(P)H-dependent glycerol-3-phosphate dehydrogenase [Elusimicrobiota bacterium]|nr:NAD(P)H-dependent glycerol-3-phosphate dehydrogenase [Elusimicrobiota bacterium]
MKKKSPDLPSPENERIAVIGGGSWGATLANLLAQKGHAVSVWEFLPETVKHLRETRTLKVLPQLRLHPSVEVTHDLPAALREKRLVVMAVPSAHVRATCRAIQEGNVFPPNAWAVSVTKGIENDSLKRMSEIIAEEIPAAKNRIAVLSGPSHAEEVAKSVPTAVVVAGPDRFAERVQKIFNTDTFRVYSSTDFIGVELGGAIKNIYAIATGICDGLGLGDNTKAALMTRSLNEMIRLGMACGARGLTFFGLSGMGDLIVTCGSRHSRNRFIGEKIGRGESLKQALSEMTMVAEGVPTAKSAYQLAQRFHLELPIVNEVYRCLYEDKPARRALQDLLTRPVAGEMWQVENLFKKGMTL